MHPPFFITGLPRSRTAWLANLFTTGPSFCLHDACKDGWSAEFLAGQLAALAPHYARVGDSDSGLLLIAPRLVAMFPTARWLFIRNTPERAAASARKYFCAGNEYPGLPAEADYEAIMRNAFAKYELALELPTEAIELSMEDLDDPELVKWAWRFLLPGADFDERRFKLLDTLRVNVMPSKITVQIPAPLEGPI